MQTFRTARGRKMARNWELTKGSSRVKLKCKVVNQWHNALKHMSHSTNLWVLI